MSELGNLEAQAEGRAAFRGDETARGHPQPAAEQRRQMDALMMQIRAFQFGEVIAAFAIGAIALLAADPMNIATGRADLSATPATDTARHDARARQYTPSRAGRPSCIRDGRRSPASTAVALAAALEAAGVPPQQKAHAGPPALALAPPPWRHRLRGHDRRRQGTAGLARGAASRWPAPRSSAEQVSKDGTRKWLIRSRRAGDEVETVYIPEVDRGTLASPARSAAR